MATTSPAQESGLDKPVIPASERIPEITVKAIILGIILAVVLGAANAYLGLFAGLTVSASIPAAVISLGIFSIVKGTILENNIVQTTASSGEAVAGGIIFTIPALIILGAWESFNYIEVTVIAALGGTLGVLFTVPLRRALLSPNMALPFPEGIATAEVLKTGHDAELHIREEGEEKPASGLERIALGAAVGAALKFLSDGFNFYPSAFNAAGRLGNASVFNFGWSLSPALLGVGYIVGFNIAVLVFIGGALSWWVGIPLFAAFGLDSDPEIAKAVSEGSENLAALIWSEQIRYLGVGAMVVGGLYALIDLRKPLIDGMKSGLAAGKEVVDGARIRTEADLPLKWVIVAICAAVIPIFILYGFVVDDWPVALLLSVIMVAAGFLFAAVAAYMAGLVGSSNNPISGVTIATVLFTSLILLGIMGSSDVFDGARATILVAAVVATASAIGSDNMQDLKAGIILGSTPWRQQTMQIVGVIAAALVMAPILELLLEANGFGAPTAEHPNPLPAPQATLIAAVAKGVFEFDLPWTMVIAGCVLAIIVILIDRRLRAAGAAFRMPVLAVAVGLYLPIELSTPIFIGGVVAWLVEQRRKAPPKGADHGLLLASGLITGEALAGVVIALITVLTSAGSFAFFDAPLWAWPGIVFNLAIAYWLYYSGTRQETVDA